MTPIPGAKCANILHKRQLGKAHLHHKACMKSCFKPTQTKDNTSNCRLFMEIKEQQGG